MLLETFLTVKEGQSSLVIHGDGKKDYFDYLNGMDFKDINQIDFEATIQAHSKDLPCLNVEMERLDACGFGELFYFFQYACYISAEILGVNPFDQPGVEAYKARLFAARKGIADAEKESLNCSWRRSDGCDEQFCMEPFRRLRSIRKLIIFTVRKMGLEGY